MAKIKETLELIAAFREVAIIGVEVFGDGVQLKDAFALGKIAAKFDILKKGVEGIGNIDDELKDLDAEETAVITKELFGIVKDLQLVLANVKRD